MDRVGAGGDLAGVDLGGETVEELEHLVGREVEAGVGAHGRAELAHDGGGPHPTSHHVADDQGGAARADGDDVVPVAADRGVRATGLVGGGDPQVVGLLQLLRKQGALEGDGRFAVAALAGAEPFGRFGVVGDVGGVHEHSGLGASLALVLVLGLFVAPGPFAVGFGIAVPVYRGAGHGVRIAAAGLAGLDRTGCATAQDLVHEGQQAELGELGHGLGGGGAGRAGAEGGGVGVVDVRDPVVGAVHQSHQGRQLAEDVLGGEILQGGVPVPGRIAVRVAPRAAVRWAGPGPGPCVLGAGRGHGTVLVPCGGATLRSGEAGAPTREVHGISGLVCRSGPLGRAARCRSLLGRVTLCRCGPTYGHTSSVADRTDSRRYGPAPVG